MLSGNLLVLTACANPPEMDRIRVKSALAQAQKVQADLYAPYVFKAGAEEFEKAETEVLIQLSRPRAFRRFSEAQRRFQKADEMFRAAVQESVRRRAELRRDAEENLREFDRIGSDIEKQLSALQDRFVNRKQVNKDFDELNSLRGEVPAIRVKLESGDHRSAYYAASNLRIRETLLYQETHNLVQRQLAASIH